MTVQEAERYYAAIVISAKDWACGLYTIGNQIINICKPQELHIASRVSGV